MLPDNIKEELARMKTLKVSEDLPKDLRVAVETFIEQAVIVGEYELDHMPAEYMENLLKTIAKYPEHSLLLIELVQILEENELVEY
jgi:hypothetical protein